MGGKARHPILQVDECGKESDRLQHIWLFIGSMCLLSYELQPGR